jgi:hypothetical protein
MLSAKLKEAAGNSADATLYVDDVFSTWLYTGNGSTQTITNGIDLAGKGGLVWCKKRDSVITNGPHYLTDTNRGAGNYLTTSSTAASSYDSQINAFNNNGFSIGSDGANVNLNGSTYASWTFRKAAKFFDVVTYTGTGSARTIAHNLGIAPGMVIVKRTDTTGNWQVYHRSLTSAANSIQLNLTAAQASAPTVWNSTAPTSSVFSVGTDATVNASGGTYVAYLYAHDTSSTGVIQCGSYTGNGSATGPVVTLGWEPQYLMVKRAVGGTGNWQIIDSMRGMPVGSADATLQANLANAESSVNYVSPTATGFQITSTSTEVNTSGSTYIYMAIRRPNKPPTSGTQVYQPDRPSSSGTFTIDAGFPIDFSIAKGPTAGDAEYVGQRLTGPYALDTTNANGEYNLGWGFASNTSATIAGTGNYSAWISWNFKRAPGFFDVVCYSGSNTDNTLKSHNLGVKPEMIIVKTRSVPGSPYDNWFTWTKDTTEDKYLYLNATNAEITAPNPTFGPFGTYAQMTTTGWYIQNAGIIDRAGDTYVAYLFATLAGISKVGSYTGNGTGQAIACGFGSAGARFVLIKRTDSTGSWYTFDSARGLTSGSSPYLLLNSTAAEVTGNNGVYASSGGFTLGATAITTTNIATATYIFLAVA